MTENLYTVYGDPPRVVSTPVAYEKPEWYSLAREGWDDPAFGGGEWVDKVNLVGLGIATTPEEAVQLHLSRRKAEELGACAAWQGAARALVAAIALQAAVAGGEGET